MFNIYFLIIFHPSAIIPLKAVTEECRLAEPGTKKGGVLPHPTYF
jgi:hypothetical protein